MSEFVEKTLEVWLKGGWEDGPNVRAVHGKSSLRHRSGGAHPTSERIQRRPEEISDAGPRARAHPVPTFNSTSSASTGCSMAHRGSKGRASSLPALAWRRHLAALDRLQIRKASSVHHIPLTSRKWRGRIGPPGPFHVPLYAAPCCPVPVSERNYAISFIIPAVS